MAACMAAIVALGQAPFALDESFHTEIQGKYVNSILCTDNANLIASGIMYFPGEINPKRLVRLLSDGERDPEFNNSGLGEGKLTRWNDRFYVATSQTVRRILPNGLQDPTFIEMNLGPYFLSLQGGDYYVFPDGRVLIAGLHQLEDTVRGFVGFYSLVWFSNEGYLDTTRVHRQGNGALGTLAALADGRFLCSGGGGIFDGQPVDYLFRVEADGAVDTTYHAGMDRGYAHCILPLADGRAYAGGTYWTTQLPDDTVRLARFLANGTLDPGFAVPQFGISSEVAATQPLGGYVWSLHPWKDGQVVACGQFSQVNGEARPGICILDSTGALMPAFADCSLGSYSYYPGFASAMVTDFQVDPDSTHYYISGVYDGYHDAAGDHPEQRFISRLFVGDVTTAVPEPTEPPPFTLQPNPASTEVSIRCPACTARDIMRLRDATGREVRRLSPLTQQTVDLHGLSPSTYVVEHTTGEGRTHSEKLIVRP